MIKLIASDLDGTLLAPDGSLPDTAFDVIAPIVDSGVLFIPASGRQYESLKRLFAPLADKTAFICENGALVKYMDRTIHLNPIPDDIARRMITIAKSIPGVSVIYCGEQTAFVESTYEPFYSHAVRAYPCNKKVDRLEDIVGIEPCCKIAMYSTIAASMQAYPAILPHIDENLSATLSGGHWCDVMAKSANKGSAMEAVQKLFGVTKDECAAFGDHLNDTELFYSCGTTFAPENAQPQIKALATRIIPSNADMGVLFTLQRLFLEGKLKP